MRHFSSFSAFVHSWYRVTTVFPPFFFNKNIKLLKSLTDGINLLNVCDEMFTFDCAL